MFPYVVTRPSGMAATTSMTCDLNRAPPSVFAIGLLRPLMNHLRARGRFHGLSASTAKAVAASDMNLPEWLAGSRFLMSDRLCQAPVAV